MKKIILLACLCISLNAKDVILWDLHRVLLNRSTTGTIKALLSTNIPASFANLGWEQFKALLGLSLDNLVHTKSGEDYIYIAREYNNKPLINIILAVANAQTIMPGMQELIQELDNLKLEQHIGSNIGKTAFDEIIKDPELLPVFEHMKLNKSKVVEFDPERVIKKPDPLFFKQYLAKNNYNPEKTRIIFIDDKKENIDIANQLGLVGIHFKDANQLRKDLRDLGIMVNPPTQKQTRFQAYRHLFK